MRRLIAIPLLVLYIVAVSGMMIQLHYCGSKLSSWKVNAEHAPCCCASSEEVAGIAHAKKQVQLAQEDDDCCQNKTITLKIRQDQNRVNQIQFQLTSLQVAAPAAFLPVPAFDLVKEDLHASYQANAPPGPWQHIPLYLLHGSFTYYG